MGLGQFATSLGSFVVLRVFRRSNGGRRLDFGKLLHFFVIQDTLLPNFVFLTILSLLAVLFRPNHHSGFSGVFSGDGELDSR